MKALFWVAVFIVCVWAYQSRSTTPAPVPPAYSPYSEAGSDSDEPEERHAARETFDGYTCTMDCSGHEAGYRWAEEHGIDDEGDCDTAADHSNSPSFGEGCKAYVNGEAEGDSDDEAEDE